jgi:hypothetical protein
MLVCALAIKNKALLSTWRFFGLELINPSGPKVQSYKSFFPHMACMFVACQMV